MQYFFIAVCAVLCCSCVVQCDLVNIVIAGCGPGLEGEFSQLETVINICSWRCCFVVDLDCKVEEVTVDTCALDRSTKACILKRGLNYTLNIDFVPEFDGDDITLLAYALLPGADAEFQGMDENACHWMTCPLVKGVKQTYTFNLSMRRSYPAGMFNVRWLMKKAGQPKCCFTNKFKIVWTVFKQCQQSLMMFYLIFWIKLKADKVSRWNCFDDLKLLLAHHRNQSSALLCENKNSGN